MISQAACLTVIKSVSVIYCKQNNVIPRKACLTIIKSVSDFYH